MRWLPKKGDKLKLVIKIISEKFIYMENMLISLLKYSKINLIIQNIGIWIAIKQIYKDIVEEKKN